jgi:hypothetical protein
VLLVADHAQMIAAYRAQARNDAWGPWRAACALVVQSTWCPAGCVLAPLYSLYRHRIACLRLDMLSGHLDAVADAETR